MMAVQGDQGYMCTLDEASFSYSNVDARVARALSGTGPRGGQPRQLTTHSPQCHVALWPLGLISGLLHAECHSTEGPDDRILAQGPTAFPGWA